MTKEVDEASVVLVQKHQLDSAQNKLGTLNSAISGIEGSQAENSGNLDDLLAQMSDLLAGAGIDPSEMAGNEVDPEIQKILTVDEDAIAKSTTTVSLLDTIDASDASDWKTYINTVSSYSERNDIDLTRDPFKRLMTDTQRISIEKRINEELTYKATNCDKYDYMIAGTCGLIGGLIDIIFVGAPGEGTLTKLSDSAIDKAVESFAGTLGWNKENAENRGSDATGSAIGFLEGKFKVNYDQATSNGRNGTGGAVKNMSMTNHHMKSLGHSPDIIGLFFSILDQFNSTSHFISEGKIVSVDTETFELKGSNFVSKVFCGFCNWLGHLFSDMAGSSGTRNNTGGRGAGIPIPFYSMFQLFDVGEFGQHKQTFATVAVKVFEQGYDMRHGLAMAIPVLITELLTRIMWVMKQRMYHGKDWKDCIPSATNPELRRMLLVAHGSLCLIDAGDAAIRSGGDITSFLLRTNLIGWARFGTLAIKEVTAWYRAGHLDIDAANEYLDEEYRRMLAIK
ncbi:MAG: hypothetical protein RPT25_08890 [Cycloclasticus sp.]|jgi:hypothetical protein